MKNVKDAARIPKFKYQSDKHTVMFLFDQSSCHHAFGEDTLNSHVMNIRPGRAQPVMHNKDESCPCCHSMMSDPKGKKRRAAAPQSYLVRASPSAGECLMLQLTI